jgi:hypothetical protein
MTTDNEILKQIEKQMRKDNCLTSKLNQTDINV